MALLTRGSVDIDQGDPGGATPLMFAAHRGYLRVVRILLKKGANMFIQTDKGYTAVHSSVREGHLAVTKLLVKAGADLEAATSTGCTPLHTAASRGYPEIASVLIEAGANPNSCMLDGVTPMFAAGTEGHVVVIKVLLRAQADPLLPGVCRSSGIKRFPLDMAAENGHSGVVRELLRQVGIEGCGGDSGGVDALELAAQEQHIEIMGMLMGAGVVDTGATVLISAAEDGRVAAAKILLQQGKLSTRDEDAYINARCSSGRTALTRAICGTFPRIVRLLVDAGADTTSVVRFTDTDGEVVFDDTPLALTVLYLRSRRMGQEKITEEGLYQLEAIHRLLMQEEAVHAVSWLWPSDIPCDTIAESTGRTKATSSPFTSMLPILRQRARRRGVLVAALFR